MDHLLILVDRRVTAPPEKLRAASEGRINGRHSFLPAPEPGLIDALPDVVAEIDQVVDRDLAPFRDPVFQWRTIAWCLAAAPHDGCRGQHSLSLPLVWSAGIGG